MDCGFAKRREACGDAASRRCNVICCQLLGLKGKHSGMVPFFLYYCTILGHGVHSFNVNVDSAHFPDSS